MQITTITTQDKKTAVLAHFDDVREWLDYGAQSSYFAHDNDFTGYQTIPSYRQAVKNNDVLSSNILKRLNGFSVSIDIQADYTPTPSLEITHSEAGFFCNTVAHFAGEENCMLSLDTVYDTKPVVWLASSMGGAFDVSAKAFHNRGIVFMLAVEQLQRLGYSVGIVAYSFAQSSDGYKSSHGSHKITGQTVIVKRPDEPYNATLVANVLGHPAALRTNGFSVRTRLSSDNGGVTTSGTKELFTGASIDTDCLNIFTTTSSLEEFKDIAAAVVTMVKQAQQNKAAK